MNEYISNLATAIGSNKKTNLLLSLGLNLGIGEGTLAHKQLAKQLALYLKRNLNAGERRRLCYLIAGKAQVNTVKLTANTTNKALVRVPLDADIRASKAIKNVV